MSLLASVPGLAVPSTSSIIIGIVLILGFIMILVMASMFRGKSKSGKRGGTAARQKYSKWVFRRMADSYGLSREQTHLLEELVTAYKIKQPYLLFSNARFIDEVLQKALHLLNEQVGLPHNLRERKQALIFQIKQAIESRARQGVGISSTRMIHSGQGIILVLGEGKQLKLNLLRNQPSGIVLEVPEYAQDLSSLFKKGNKIKAFFWRAKDSGYAFATKILDTGQEDSGKVVLLQHADHLKRNQQRKFRRKPFNRKCFFYPVEILTLGKGKKIEKKAVVQYKLRYIGTILDISAGGCSIICKKTPDKGKYVKVETKINTAAVNIFGRVRKATLNESDQNLIVHVMFTKLSTHDRNEIYSYVYNYI